MPHLLVGWPNEVYTNDDTNMRVFFDFQVFVLMQFDPGLEYKPSRGARGKDDAS